MPKQTVFNLCTEEGSSLCCVSFDFSLFDWLLNLILIVDWLFQLQGFAFAHSRPRGRERHHKAAVVGFTCESVRCELTTG